MSKHANIEQAPTLTTADKVKVGDTIQHPARQWDARRVIAIQQAPRDRIRFVITSTHTADGTTGVTFPVAGPILIHQPTEHDYIASPGTEGDSFGPLVCRHCGMSAE